MYAFDFNELLGLLERAAINGAEAAGLFKVSRTLVYEWLTRGNGPHQEVIRAFTLRQIALIQKAITAGALPLNGVPKRDRKRMLSEVLRKQM